MDRKVQLVLLVNMLSLVIFVAGNNADKIKKELETSKNSNVMDVSDFSVYYDLKTNQTIKKMMPRPWYRPGWPLRLPFSGGPCTCEGIECKCCSGIRIPAFSFDRQVCSKLTYNDTDSMIDMVVTMNGEKIYNNSYSARNPPPFCVPIPVPYLPPGLVDICIRLFDLSFVEQKLHVCMDMDTRIDKAPVLVLHFDCMSMGFSGVSLSKPGTTGGTQVATANVTNPAEPEQQAGDIYDLVEETKITVVEKPYNNYIKYIK